MRSTINKVLQGRVTKELAEKKETKTKKVRHFTVTSFWLDINSLSVPTRPAALYTVANSSFSTNKVITAAMLEKQARANVSGISTMVLCKIFAFENRRRMKKMQRLSDDAFVFYEQEK